MLLPEYSLASLLHSQRKPVLSLISDANCPVPGIWLELLYFTHSDFRYIYLTVYRYDK